MSMYPTSGTLLSIVSKVGTPLPSIFTMRDWRPAVVSMPEASVVLRLEAASGVLTLRVLRVVSVVSTLWVVSVVSTLEAIGIVSKLGLVGLPRIWHGSQSQGWGILPYGSTKCVRS
jgi:hypothetical protein